MRTRSDGMPGFAVMVENSPQQIAINNLDEPHAFEHRRNESQFPEDNAA